MSTKYYFEKKDTNKDQPDISMNLIPISLKDNVDRLKYELEKSQHNEGVLKMRLNRRTEVLDAIRAQYLRDVVIMKEQFYGNHENLDKYTKTSAARDMYNGLPKSVLERMLPQFDLRQSLPCFRFHLSPNFDAVLPS